MKAYLANLGERNVHWPTCKAENVLTLETSNRLYEFWARNDRNGWLAWATENERMVNGQPAIRAVASRWFNLLAIFHETQNGVWIHRDADYLFWTVSKAGPVSKITIEDPKRPTEPSILLKRPTEPWRNRSKDGRILGWRSLHPKAHHFLQTEATYQEIANDRRYKDYALSILEGPVLSELHSEADWKETLGTKEPVTVSSALETTIYDAVWQVGKTVLRADGRMVERQTKIKDLLVSDQQMREFLHTLYHEQDGLCALTGIRMLLAGQDGPIDLKLSIDRIDSNGHYEPKNVQLVCRFANFWKSDNDNGRFKELIELVKNH